MSSSSGCGATCACTTTPRCRGGRGRSGGRAVRARPGAAASRPAPPRVAFLYRDAARPGRRAARARRPAGRAPRRPGAAWCRRVAARSAPARCTSAPTSARTAPPGRAPSRQALRRRRRWCAPARRTRSRRDGCVKARRHAVQGVHAVLPSLARARLARSGRRDHRPGRLARRAGRRRRSRTTRALPDGPRLPDAGEAGRPVGLARLPHDAIWPLRRRRDRPDLDRTSRMSAYLKWGCIHPRTMLADLGAGDETYRKELAWREFYAARAAPTGRTAPASTSCRSWPGCPTPGRHAKAFDAWQRRHDRLPDRRRRHAPAARRGLDAQPGADDRRLVPGQGPAHRVAARRPPLHAAPGRRRPGQQPARLAVDGRHRHRRGALLPGVQPGDAGPQVRPGRRLRASLGARAARRRRQGGPRAVGARRRHARCYPQRIVDHAAERKVALDRYNAARG